MAVSANRGMFLEAVLTRTAAFLASRGRAWIDKRHLPIKPYRFAGTRVEGHLRARTQTDYYGVYRGRYLDFEAKQTRAASLPLANLPRHQLGHLRAVKEFGAVCFFVVHFAREETFWALPLDALEAFLRDNPGRASVPHAYFQKAALPVDLVYPGVLDLIPALDALIARDREAEGTRGAAGAAAE